MACLKTLKSHFLRHREVSLPISRRSFCSNLKLISSSSEERSENDSENKESMETRREEDEGNTPTRMKCLYGLVRDVLESRKRRERGEFDLSRESLDKLKMKLITIDREARMKGILFDTHETETERDAKLIKFVNDFPAKRKRGKQE